MKSYLLTAAGLDKSGIVAAVTKKLYSLGCNLEDSAMTRLRGEFAILLIFTAPDQSTDAALTTSLKELETDGLVVHLKPMAIKELEEHGSAKNMCLVSVHGADRPGIVYRVTELLAQHQVNITDLSTHRTASGTNGGYILYVEGEMPVQLPVKKLEAALAVPAREMGVTVSVKIIEPAAL